MYEDDEVELEESVEGNIPTMSMVRYPGVIGGMLIISLIASCALSVWLFTVIF